MLTQHTLRSVLAEGEVGARLPATRTKIGGAERLGRDVQALKELDGDNPNLKGEGHRGEVGE